MIAAGFGFRDGTSIDSLLEVFARASADHAPNCIATAADKLQTPAFQALVQRLGLPAIPLAAGQIAAMPTATDSPASRAARNTGSLAEAAAIAAAGKNPRLVVPRLISGDRTATCAIAIGEDE